MEKIKRILWNSNLISLFGISIQINYIAIGWVSAIYGIKFPDYYVWSSELSFYALLLVCFGEIIDPFVTKYIPFLSKGRIQIQETEKPKEQNTIRQNNIGIWALLISCGLFLNSCILVKDTAYIDVIKAFSERKLKQMYNVDVSFKQDTISLQKEFEYQSLERYFSKRLLRQFTAKGYIEVDNLDLRTNVIWHYYEKENIPLVFINYNYYKKNK